MHRLLLISAGLSALAFAAACARHEPDVILVHGQLVGRNPSEHAMAIRGAGSSPSAPTTRF